MAALNAEVASRRAATHDVAKEKSLPPEPSVLSELRHCARCHRHLPSNVVCNQPGPYFGWCTGCQVSLSSMVTRSSKVTDRSVGCEPAWWHFWWRRAATSSFAQRSIASDVSKAIPSGIQPFDVSPSRKLSGARVRYGRAPESKESYPSASSCCHSRHSIGRSTTCQSSTWSSPR